MVVAWHPVWRPELASGLASGMAMTDERGLSRQSVSADGFADSPRHGRHGSSA
jgi:hypothetical protein